MVEQSAIFRVPTVGGAAVKLTTNRARPTYSPDGSMISCVSAKGTEVVIISASDGAQLETHRLPAFASSNFGIGWTRDGAGLVYTSPVRKTF